MKLLAICLFFASYLRSGNSIIPTSNSDLLNSKYPATTPSPSFNVGKELEKIASICLTNSEQEEMSGNIVRIFLARVFNEKLIVEAHNAIGLAEMRSLLNFAPLGPWVKYWIATPEQIANASTIEEYYVLKEPRSKMSSLSGTFFHEKNVHSVIAFLDKRIPTIRTIYRHTLNEFLLRPATKIANDRQEVDLLIQEYIKINSILDKAVAQIFTHYAC